MLQGAARTHPRQDIAAGAIYVVLSVVLFGAWLVVDRVLVLILALPTAVAGAVELSVGWSGLRRARGAADKGS